MQPGRCGTTLGCTASLQPAQSGPLLGRRATALDAVGDHVLVKRNDLRLGVVNGERGRVVAIDTEAHQLTLDCHGARVTLDADYLDDRTVHGEPSLLHGYAMTIHVAQGLTVNHAFLLAGLGLDREAGYTALSRGRETNHIYAARDKETPRAEYAPTARGRRTRSGDLSPRSSGARPRRWPSTPGTPIASPMPTATSPAPPRSDAPPRPPADHGFRADAASSSNSAARRPRRRPESTTAAANRRNSTTARDRSSPNAN